MEKIILGNVVIFAIFIFDRLVKIFCRAGRGFLFFKNSQLAFGLPFPKNILIALIIIILFILFFFLIKSYQRKNIFFIISLTLIILGSISNLIDRLVYGYVIDYINIPYFTVLNLADIMIVSGTALLFFKNLKFKRF